MTVAHRAAAALLALMLLAAALPAAAQRTGELDALRAHALELVNGERRAEGLAPLALAGPLDAAAQAHAEDMLARGYYDHVSPEGRDVADRFRARGGSQWALIAENIANCSPCAEVPDTARVAALHRGWMESPEHRANILRAGLTQFGFGIAAGPRGPLYAVQTFAGPGTARSAASGGGTSGEASGVSSPLPSGDAGDRFAGALNDRRAETGLAPLRLAPALSALAGRLLPESAGAAVTLDPPGGLMAALPAEARDDWRSVSVLAGSCGGCGAAPDAADIGYFLGLWLDDAGYRRRLLDGGPTAIGFALRAYGDGRKVAVAVLGTGR